MAAEASRAPCLRERQSFAQRMGAFYHEMAPAIMCSRDAAGTERWDGRGVGPGYHFGFEGFGISFSIFFGRMPGKEDAA